MAPLAGVIECTTTVAGLLPPSMSVGNAGVSSDQLPAVKCVLVGDGAVGKTSLLASYAISEYPTDYRPTAFDNYAVVVRVDDQPIRLHLRDTAGQLELDSLRTLCYADADVFLLCFNVACPDSFDAVTSRWLPEIRRMCPSTPVILVGTQSDRRHQAYLGADDSKSAGKKRSKLLVSDRQAERLAERIGAAAYIECSASEQTKVKDVFDAAIVVAVDRRGLVKRLQSKGDGTRKGAETGDFKSSEYNGLRADYTSDQKRRQQRRHRWKHLLCCCGR